MNWKKRKKRTRYRGNKSHGRGRKNRTRGSGNQGGVGMAGTGKRGDAKKTLVLKLYGNAYFGKKLPTRKKKKPSINLETIRANLAEFIKKGIAHEHNGGYELKLNEYKVIGDADIGMKIVIHARAVSKGAAEAVKKTGGEIIISEIAKKGITANKKLEISKSP